MRYFFAVISIVFVLGCSPEPEKAVIEVKEGVTYVCNPRMHISEQRLIKETVFKSDDNSEFVFAEVSDIKEGPNGEVFIVDQQDNKIGVFSYDGEYLTSFGGKGEGPGEFEGVDCLDFFNDGNILISDVQNLRFQIFDSEYIYLDSVKRQFGSPGKFVIDSSGRIINRPVLIFFGVEDGDKTLLNVCDSDFNPVQGFGEVKEFNEPLMEFIMNNCYLALADNDRLCLSYMIENRICIYEDDKLLYDINRPLFFEQKKPEVKTEKSGDEISFITQFYPLCHDIDVDSKGNIYVLTVYIPPSEEIDFEQDGSFEMILEIFNSQGVLQKIIPVLDIMPTNLHIGKGDKIYLNDTNEMQVLRYAALDPN